MIHEIFAYLIGAGSTFWTGFVYIEGCPMAGMHVCGRNHCWVYFGHPNEACLSPRAIMWSRAGLDTRQGNY